MEKSLKSKIRGEEIIEDMKDLGRQKHILDDDLAPQATGTMNKNKGLNKLSSFISKKKAKRLK